MFIVPFFTANKPSPRFSTPSPASRTQLAYACMCNDIPSDMCAALSKRSTACEMESDNREPASDKEIFISLAFSLTSPICSTMAVITRGASKSPAAAIARNSPAVTFKPAATVCNNGLNCSATELNSSPRKTPDCRAWLN